MSITMMSLDERFAKALDQSDPLASFGPEFEVPIGTDGTPLIYLVGNSLGLMPRAARGMLNQELDDWARFGVEGHHVAATPWYSYHELFRDSGARLVGARPGEVVMMNSLTVNLHLMLTTFYRPQGSRTKVVVEEHTFPSDSYAIASHLGARGVDPADHVITLRPRPNEATLRTDDIEAVLQEQGTEIALLLLGGVNYYSGQCFDLGRLAEAARRQGIGVGYDLAHAVGNVPLALHDWDVDFAVWCSYKYLNGGPGAVGGCFVHERHGRELSLPRLGGWWGNDPDTRFEMRHEFVPRVGADGWQVSNPPVFSMAPLRASLELFDRAGLAQLRVKSESLTGYLEALLLAIPGSPITLLTPSDPAGRGCQLSLQIPGRGRWLHDALRARGIVTDYREPDVVRMAPVPLYNTYHQVWRTAQAVRTALAHG
jgi:kynureninase